MTKKIISFTAIKNRKNWIELLGGLSKPIVKNQEWLELLVDDGRNTLSIEGEFDNRWDLEEILEKPNYGDLSVRKVLNFFDTALFAYEFAFLQFQEKKFEIPKTLLLHLHSKMFREVPRSFSQKPGEWALGGREIRKSKFNPVPPTKIEKSIKELLWFVQNLNAAPTRKAAIFHAFFEHIHPFPDGNGRLGRIILNFILVAHGLPAIAVKGVKKADREKYYAALENADTEIYKILSDQKTFANLDFAAFSELENLLEKPLAVALDIVICRKFELQKSPLLKLSGVAKILKKNPKSLAVAASQKKIISVVRKNVSWSHPDFFAPPKI